MSENVISFGNTPIFDQLQAEFAARGRAYESLIAKGPINLRPAKLQGVRAPYVTMDELPEVMEKLQTDESVDAAANHAAPVVKTLREHFEKDAVIEQFTIDPIKVNPEPVDVSYEDLVKFASEHPETFKKAHENIVVDFLKDQMVEFYQDHPGAEITDVTTEHQLDGSVKVMVKAKEPNRFGGVSFSEAIAGIQKFGEHMSMAGKSVMDYYAGEEDGPRLTLDQIQNYYEEGIASVNTLRRAHLESNDSEPSVGRP